jgi:hypothetical protein
VALLLIKLSFNLVGYWERPADARLCALMVCGMVILSSIHLVVINYACSVTGDHVIPVLALGLR